MRKNSDLKNISYVNFEMISMIITLTSCAFISYSPIRIVEYCGSASLIGFIFLCLVVYVFYFFIIRGVFKNEYDIFSMIKKTYPPIIQKIIAIIIYLFIILYVYLLISNLLYNLRGSIYTNSTIFSISIFFIVPMAVGIALLSKNLIRIIYERGEFSVNSTNLTSAALQFYAIGMLGYGLMEVLNKTFYAKQDARTPMFISGFAIIVNICLSILLVKIMGYTGLPFAASITSLLTTVVMLVIINKKMSGIVDKESFKELLKTIFSAMSMGVIVYLVGKIYMPSVISLAVSVFLGALVYIIFELILKSEIVKDGIEMIKNRIAKK